MNHQNLPSDGDETGYERDEIRWTCVATAPDQLLAEVWQQLMREASIPSMLAPQDTISFLGVTPTPVRLMVPMEMRARAEEVLSGLADGGDTGPEADETC